MLLPLARSNTQSPCNTGINPFLIKSVTDSVSCFTTSPFSVTQPPHTCKFINQKRKFLSWGRSFHYKLLMSRSSKSIFNTILRLNTFIVKVYVCPLRSKGSIGVTGSIIWLGVISLWPQTWSLIVICLSTLIQNHIKIVSKLTSLLSIKAG
jgi:hypothetical protein